MMELVEQLRALAEAHEGGPEVARLLALAAKMEREHAQAERRTRRVNLPGRAVEMSRLFIEEKLSLQEIADRYNLSRERIRQILLQRGVTSGRRELDRDIPALQERVAKLEERIAALEAKP